MNTTLKSSNLVPLSIAPEKQNQSTSQSLALIEPAPRQEQPSSQQKQAIARVYVEQAGIYFQARNWHDAIAACKNALNLDSQNTDAYKILGNILKTKGKDAEALGVYAKALEINPNSAPIYANLGSFYAQQKNWQQALDYYQQAVIIDPTLAGAYRSLARVWEELGSTEQALECLCRAVNLEPEQLSAAEYFSFGDLLDQQQKLKEASIFYIHGVKLNPQPARLAKLVKMLEKLGDWQQAVAFYHQLIALSNGKSPRMQLKTSKPIASLLSKSKAAAKAKPQTLVQSPTAVPSNQSNRSRLLLKSEAKSDSAVVLPVVQKQPSATSWNNLGSSYAQKQQWLKAISCYQESIELEPKLGKTHRNLAKVYAKIGKLEQSALCWYRAFTLEPNTYQPQEYFALAQKLIQMQQVDKAIACLRYSLKLHPENRQAKLLLNKLVESQAKN